MLPSLSLSSTTGGHGDPPFSEAFKAKFTYLILVLSLSVLSGVSKPHQRPEIKILAFVSKNKNN